MPLNTSVASASCGIHFGETKLVTSTVSRPVSVSRSMNAILVAAGTTALSFCKPSRGPTSTILILSGNIMALSSFRPNIHQRRFRFHHVAFAVKQLLDGARDACLDGDFHLHAFHDEQRLPGFHLVAFLHVYRDDSARHGCAGVRLIMHGIEAGRERMHSRQLPGLAAACNLDLVIKTEHEEVR